MGKIGIVTDSTSDIPEDMLKKYDIKIVPLYVNFEEESYLDDGKSITMEKFYEKLNDVKVLPKSAQPSPSDFIKAYREVLENHDSIISIHISKKMSGTIDSAEMAKKEVGADIEIIDSELVHVPLGQTVIRAAELAQQGCSKEEIISSVKEFSKKITVLFIPRILKYLIMGGRIGRAKGLIASILEINPILTLNMGEVSQYKTTRRWNQAKNELIESMKSMVKNPGSVHAFVSDSNAASEGDAMAERIRNEIRPKETSRAFIGAIVGIHLGPGAVAVTFYED